MFVREMLAHAGRLEIYYMLLRFVLLLHCQMLSPKVLSFLWHIFSKERQSFSHEMLEMLFHIWSYVDQSKEWYGDAVEFFLTEYPDGTVRKRKCSLQGHAYQKIWKSTKKPNHDVVPVLDSVTEEDAQDIAARPEDLPLGQFSDDEWSSEDEF